MQPRAFDPQHDLPAVADCWAGRAPAAGIWHPGGIQWWLRELATDRDDFEAFVWPGPGNAIDAFVMRDGAYVIAESDGGPSRGSWSTGPRLTCAKRASLRSRPRRLDGSALHHELMERGFEQSGTSLELMADTDQEPPRPTLPPGFRFSSMEEVDDETFIDGHRAAWSDNKPSPYNNARHEAVKQAPQFRPDLVTIALAPDGTVASYCIGWLDEQSQTLEIEPLGTHRDYRRLGLATAVVHEVTHRAWANGAKHVLVWNDPQDERPGVRPVHGRGHEPVSQDRRLDQEPRGDGAIMRAMRLRSILLVTLLAMTLAACSSTTAALQFSPDRLQDGAVGQPYDAIIQVTNNSTPVGDMYVSAGALPPGMTLDFSRGTSASADLQGTPTTAGSYVFTVSAWCLGTNVSGQEGEMSYSLVVS